MVTRELDFLLAALRRFFQPESCLPSADSLDWTKLVRLTESHAVLGFVNFVLPRPELKGSAREAANFNLKLSAELAKLLALFQEKSIEAVSLKGPMLGIALYGDAAVKTSSDLDLLVRPGDVPDVVRVLRSTGYRLKSAIHWPADSAYLRDPKCELSFSDHTDDIKIDLHWNLMPRYFPCLVDHDELWRKVHAAPWGHTCARTLAREHLFLFLCAHGTKHLWQRLGWLCDAARMVQIERELDWSGIRALARRGDACRMVSLTLLLASDLLGVDAPPAAGDQAIPDARTRSLAQTVMKRLHADDPASGVSEMIFRARALERHGSRARLIAGTICQPTEAEYRALQLPSRLYLLYYLFRPLRLAVKYGRRMLRL